MFYKFIYLDKKTGRTIYSQKELKDDNLKLKKAFKDTAIKSKEDFIIRKDNKKK